MKSKLIFIILIAGALLLTACSGNSQNENEDELLILEATLEVPETADVNEEITLSANVTYGDKSVTDADEVVYEIWEEGNKEESYKIESTNNEDGTYTATTSFDKDGIFHVQVHVTARALHTMPKQAITIGEGGHYEHSDENADDEHGDHGDHGEHGENNHDEH
ncbi:FixH family protein [Ornithinibacillus halotolerans]|uniref:YtkA-like domain-containing protein n=1 Tax=Ornithinibacillus halotolerans TaxID=1274357 RepID=A0A916RR78_9BACI|nr:FixH family protein [Ornithinibacillus halotolerans]GGA65756.1 hypothetical protein GCM10008025_06950 [Ornithinibacillus halotolerans]